MAGAVIRPFRRDDTEAVVALWRAAGLVVPWNDPYRDIARKLTVQPELFHVAEDASDGAPVVVGAARDSVRRSWPRPSACSSSAAARS